MSEEKKTPVKAEEGKGSKFVNWIKNLPANIAKPFKNMVAELRKVTWPSKKKLISSAVMVLLFMFFMGLVIGLLDLGSNALVKTLISNPSAAVEQPVETPAEETVEVPAETTDAAETTTEETAPEAAE